LKFIGIVSNAFIITSIQLISHDYELVDANRGIQKVRVEPATRSAVATCYH